MLHHRPTRMRRAAWRQTRNQYPPGRTSTCNCRAAKTLAIVGEKRIWGVKPLRRTRWAERPIWGEVLFRPDPLRVRWPFMTCPPPSGKHFNGRRKWCLPDPYSSAQPAHAAYNNPEPNRWRWHKTSAQLLDRREKAVKCCGGSGLNPDIALGPFPHAFSGGQRNVCRSPAPLTLNPKLLIFDDPPRADVCVQGTVRDPARKTSVTPCQPELICSISPRSGPFRCPYCGMRSR